MTNENLTIWDKFADIDPKYTKAITGKPYKGTSPNPHYVIKCLTELFGPVGVGFGWDVEAEGFQPMGEELLHWCRIRFWHSDQKSRGFSAYGQTKAVMKTRNGLMTDEDAPKKSLTDAITKAAAQVGIASNIFLGRWDDSKYVDEVNDKFREAEKPAPDPEQEAREQAEAAARAKQQADQFKNGILRDLNGARTIEAITNIENHPKFKADMVKLRAMSGDAALEVEERLGEIKAEFTPRDQSQRNKNLKHEDA